MPTPELVFVIVDGSILKVFACVDEVYDEIDSRMVERGAVKFFNKLGEPLVPRFVVANLAASKAIRWAKSKQYRLILNPENNANYFQTYIDHIKQLDANSFFSHINDIKAHFGLEN